VSAALDRWADELAEAGYVDPAEWDAFCFAVSRDAFLEMNRRNRTNKQPLTVVPNSSRNPRQ